MFFIQGAHAHLLTQDCLTIPTRASVYCQLVSSKICAKWNHLHDINDKIVIPEDKRGSGASSLALHDLQLSQMEGEFEALTPITKIFDFDFGKSNGKDPIPLHRQSVNELILQRNDKKVDAIFLWWDLKMDPNQTIVLSCAPYWAHPDKVLFDKNIKEMVRSLFMLSN